MSSKRFSVEWKITKHKTINLRVIKLLWNGKIMLISQCHFSSDGRDFWLINNKRKLAKIHLEKLWKLIMSLQCVLIDWWTVFVPLRVIYKRHESNNGIKIWNIFALKFPSENVPQTPQILSNRSPQGKFRYFHDTTL